jgi:hypothetical protein
MPNYRQPGTTVTTVDNPRIINIAGDTMIPAIVGIGPMKRYVVDEAVTRGVGSTDNLAAYPATTLVTTQIANTPGIAVGSAAAVDIALNGALYANNVAASGSTGTTGIMTWLQGTVPVDIPATGSTYYVTYNYDVPATQFDPTILSNKTSILSKYGSENTASGSLTIAGSIVLENGSPAVMLVQASGSTYTEAIYKTAIDKLQKKKNLESIICVFPSGSVTAASQQSLQTYAFTHVVTMDNAGRGRGLIDGSPSPYSASDGFDTIGDTTTSRTYCYRANAINDRRRMYVVPSRVRRKDASGAYMELDGNYAGCVVAGAKGAQSLRSTPLTGMVVTGVVIEDEKWNEYEMNQLGAAGATVLESRSGVITIRDCITTDATSADTEEESVESVRRLVKRTLTTGLDNAFKGKGVVITSTTVLDAIATTGSILQSLVNAREINKYGQFDNPITGEVAISAIQNAQEPRQVDVTCSIMYLYPMKWISVSVSTFVG